MKAKRIVSILLTGSMLLSLLPVSALAAAPVFDAPAQTTAKKAAPLVQEADASRSTEEEAATRSSRDLDAENGTAESITIQLNAAGTPAGGGDTTHWSYYAGSCCMNLNKGTFTLQPSSEPGAVSALQAELNIYDAEFNGGTVGNRTTNYGTISGGIFQREVYNSGTISDGIFQQPVDNHETISGGTFQKPVNNYKTISGGTFWEVVEVYASFGREAKIEGGTFERTIMLMNGDASITIKDGLFDDEVVTVGCASLLSISGGLFTKAVDLSNIDDPSNLQITGGYFVSKPTLPEGSDTTFATVSDRNYRAFKVPVNGDFSEKGYNSLYVPCGSSEQPNTITVKTNTKLLYYLADGEQFPAPDSDSDSYIFEIPVRNNEKIVLVTEEHSAPPTDGSGGEIDPGFSSGAAVLGAVLGTVGFLSLIHI